MHITSYFFLLFSSFARTFLDTLLSAYIYAVLVYLTIFDFAADLIGLTDENDISLCDYCVEGLSAEQDEALELFDTIFVPYVNFYYNSIFNGAFIKAFWFFAFVVPFSHLTGAVLSNEYLLFCCITLTLFILYDRLVELLSGVFLPSLDLLRQSVSKKLVLLAEIIQYQAALGAQYSVMSSAFEELISDVKSLDTSSTEADNVVFDQTLSVAGLSSLYSAFLLESQGAEYIDYLENVELEALVLEEAISEFLLDESTTE